MNPQSPYRPTLSDEYAETMRQWHEAAYAEMRARGNVRVSYLGRTFDVPEDVFAPTPTSDLLGTAVLAETRPTDRVLDMGTGCGVNAILAASISSNVLGADVNPRAVAAARANAALNAVQARTTFLISDGFEAIDGTFDLMVLDPPFRWFRPRDLLERSIADEGYRFLTSFIEQTPSRLNAGGRILLFFGSTGDVEYLSGLIDAVGLKRQTVASRALLKGDLTVTYCTLRLTP